MMPSTTEPVFQSGACVTAEAMAAAAEARKESEMPNVATEAICEAFEAGGVAFAAGAAAVVGVPAAACVFVTAAAVTTAVAVSPRPPISFWTVSEQTSPIFRHGAKKASHRLMVVMATWETVASQSFPFRSTKRPRLPTASAPTVPAVKTARMVRLVCSFRSSVQ